MEDEKNITAPKRKRAVSESKKKSAAKENKAENTKQASNDLKAGAVGEVKPERQTKTSKKNDLGKTAKKPQSTETPEINAADEAKPSKRKTPKKSETSVGLEKAAKKSASKTVKSKTVKKKDSDAAALAAPEKLAKIRDLIEPETLREIESLKESEISAEKNTRSEPESILSSEIKTAPVSKPETQEVLKDEESPVFKELAAPKLPVLEPENRARLQMQSPTRIFFYWSLKSNPFETLRKVFSGRDGNYTLVVKLQNQTAGTEQIFPIDTSGSWWFDVESNSKYRAEVGFSDARRPFIRLLFSNTVETPRTAPSAFFDCTPRFAVTPQKFAEVLDFSGYRQDAFEVALAGDDVESSDTTTFKVFEKLIGEQRFETKAAELRLVLFALASSLSLSDLRDQISPRLFTYLEKLIEDNAERLAAEKILSALEESFGFGAAETENEPLEISYSIFGASRINFQKFPKQFWKRFAPVSSFKVDR